MSHISICNRLEAGLTQVQAKYRLIFFILSRFCCLDAGLYPTWEHARSNRLLPPLPCEPMGECTSRRRTHLMPAGTDQFTFLRRTSLFDNTRLAGMNGICRATAMQGRTHKIRSALGGMWPVKPLQRSISEWISPSFLIYVFYHILRVVIERGLGDGKAY